MLFRSVRKLDRSESLELALIENLQREDLNPVDEAEAYRSLIEQFGYKQEDLARRIGKDRSTVANVLRLLKLPEEVLDAISQGAISMGHGRALLALEEPERIREVFARVVAQSMSVRQVEEEVRRVLAGKKPRATVKDLPTPLLDLQDRLARRLGTRVRVRPRARGEGGKIVVEYYSRQDLDRLVDRMDAGPM